MEISVHVEMPDGPVLAGTLFTHRRRTTESATFTYATAWVSRSDAYTLDPQLPLSTGPAQTPGTQPLFGALSDCAPDRWGRTLIRRSEDRRARAEGRTARTLGEDDFLLGVRDDLRQGALRFQRGQPGGEGPFLADDQSGVPALTSLPELLDLADRAEANSADLPDLLRLLRAGSSLGGARPKAHVRTDDGTIAIAKFPSAAHDTWNVMAWEKVAHGLAADAGVDVPRTRLLDVGGRSVLLVDRFDRRPGNARIGYVSAMTMLEATDGEPRSYLEIAETIETHSDAATRELEELWRRVALSVLVSNTDDHLRNHGFLHHRNDIWRLAPAFDLNPTPDPGTRHLSTAISLNDDEASVGLLLDVAGFFRLHEAQARSILREVATAVARWREQATRAGLSTREQDEMAPAFSRLSDVP